MVNLTQKPILKLMAFSLFFLPITFSLGLWQLDRSEQKQKLLDQIELRSGLPALNWSRALVSDELAFRRVSLDGLYSEKDFLLDNRMRDGKVGYEVLTPFVTNGGDTLLINRGWVPAGMYRDQLPVLIRPDERVTINGFFHQSDGEIPVLKVTPAETDWPLRIQKISWPEVQQTLDIDMALELEFRLADDSEAGAYQISWKATSVMPEKHLGYAYQWFGLFTVLLVMTCYACVSLYKRKNKNDKNEVCA